MMVQCAKNGCRFDARFHKFYKRYSRRKGKGKVLVAVAHEMLRISYFILKRDEAYRGENRGLTERWLKSLERRALNGLRN